jgi:hypothetical protein
MAALYVSVADSLSSLAAKAPKNALNNFQLILQNNDDQSIQFGLTDDAGFAVFNVIGGQGYTLDVPPWSNDRVYIRSQTQVTGSDTQDQYRYISLQPQPAFLPPYMLTVVIISGFPIVNLANFPVICQNNDSGAIQAGRTDNNGAIVFTLHIYQGYTITLPDQNTPEASLYPEIQFQWSVVAPVGDGPGTQTVEIVLQPN